MASNAPDTTAVKNDPGPSIPSISLPKGGGGIRTIDEKMSVNAANGTAGVSLPLPLSPSRDGFTPPLALGYSSGGGNGVFGLGWSASLPSITRKTESRLPDYTEQDIFIFSGAEDLVPVYVQDGTGKWVRDVQTSGGMRVERYRPRVEGDLSRIERITTNAEAAVGDGVGAPAGAGTGAAGDEGTGAGGAGAAEVYWKVTSKDNSVAVLGRSAAARIADPSDPSRVYSWLLEFSYDDKGQCWQAEYKQEDLAGVTGLSEKNRLNGVAGCANAYLKRVRYGNAAHFDREAIRWDDWEHFLSGISYLLEVVFDYGEHDPANPQPDEGDAGGAGANAGDANAWGAAGSAGDGHVSGGVWSCRQDPFSVYRSGFDIRTYRLCRRVLMFHRFAELGAEPCLVRSMELTYNEGTAFTFLTAVTQKGFIRTGPGAYSMKALPPVEFSYQPLEWDTEVRVLSGASMENLPTGIDDHDYQWIDLYNEGISGILTEDAGAWFYKSNNGDGVFTPAMLVARKPSLAGLVSGGVHFQDIEGRGEQYLVSEGQGGYFKQNVTGDWEPFRAFPGVPTIDPQDPNVRWLDLNGDGRADLLLTEEEVLLWHASLGEEGYAPYRTVPKPSNEERGPALVFNDPLESVVLADMTGDGLRDIVRIRNGEVVYWPNKGYGRFGAKVTMCNSPVFDTLENFHPRWVKLADVDGSGTTDILYLGRGVCQVFFNQSGNGWSGQNIVGGANPLPFPRIDNQVNLTVIDLLGKGTPCLVWSSPMPAESAAPLYYIDLAGGRKPHLLSGYKNNMGREISFEYLPSTYFYLEDKKAGRPWATKLPFPVQCVHQVVAVDRVANTRFTSQYSYHHGYYDPAEREFRGFARVEQTDTEDFDNFRKQAGPGGSVQIVDEAFHQPPVLTKSWFHTGVFVDEERVFDQLAHEYFQNAVAPERLIDDLMPENMTTEEWREALRACKGLLLRTEVYTPDGTAQAGIPYTTGNHSCVVRMLQPVLDGNPAVFLVLEREALNYTYERNPADPRVSHSMVLDVDIYGNILRSATVTYGRRTVDASLRDSEAAEQSKTHIVLKETNYTPVIDTMIDYRLPVGFDTKGWELTGTLPAADGYFRPEEVMNAWDQAVVLPFESTATAGMVQRRLLSALRSVFLKDDLSGPLPAGVIEALGLPYTSYKMVLTPGLRDKIFGGRVDDVLLTGEGKYVRLEDGNYWLPGGLSTFDAGHFYQVTAVTDPMGSVTQLTYEPTYRFFVQQTTDAVGNITRVGGYNFRTLQPYLVQDINDNRQGVRFDELGQVTASFAMGKAEENKGDRMDLSGVETSPGDVPGQVLDYDLDIYRSTGGPNFSRITVREVHFFDSPGNGGAAGGMDGGATLPVQVTYQYADGGGKVLLIKKQAEPGMALQLNADGTTTLVDTSPNLRWIGNGRTIVNNKGLPVKQYEPYFSVSSAFEDAKALVELGVTPLITYDAAGRVVRTDLPGGTLTRVEFDAWRQRSFDLNDTVLESGWYADRVTTPVTGVATPEEIDAAGKTAAHANTPTISYFDSLGRTFLTVVDNGPEGAHRTFLSLDISNNILQITDPRGIAVMQYQSDMQGARLYRRSSDAGERWALSNVLNHPIRRWDSRGHVFRHEYDGLNRVTKTFLQDGEGDGSNGGSGGAGGGGREIFIEQTVYGEGVAGDKTANLRGQVYQSYDQAGVASGPAFDFKGNPLQTSRRLCVQYKGTIDWSGDVPLDEMVFLTSSTFDALNRPTSVTSADQSVYIAAFNERGTVRSVQVRLRGAANPTVFIDSLLYDVQGRREQIVYGNGTRTGYQYDPLTFRLAQLQTTAAGGNDLLQLLRYTYDPTGNITTLRDDAQQTVFFNNSVVTPSTDYSYDALYRLTVASGREHIGQNRPAGPDDGVRMNLPMPGDGSALRNYTQRYQYDAAGNILQLAHSAGAGSWTRTYRYDTASNRLLSQTVGDNTENYGYDAHGNIKTQAQLQGLSWNFSDLPSEADLGGGGTAFYVYGEGQRLRKVIERPGGVREERIYLGSFELYRLWNSAGTLQEQTETLHVKDDNTTLAMVETKTISEGSPVTEQLIRYQYSNHLGSVSLETDESGIVISYEEYYPFGSTSYQAVNAAVKAAAKRYRYTGLERDEETGLEYHNARYYLPWLGRWLSPDPIGTDGGLNLYAYSSNNPVGRQDAQGTDDKNFQGAASEEENTLRHERLQAFRGFIADHVFGRGQIERTLDKFGDTAILRNYGYEGYGTFTNPGDFRDQVVRAIDNYSGEFERIHGTAGPKVNPVTLQIVYANATKAANDLRIKLLYQGGQLSAESFGAAVVSGVTGWFTDNPETQLKAAQYGAALDGLLQAASGTVEARQQIKALSGSGTAPTDEVVGELGNTNLKSTTLGIQRGGKPGEASGTTKFPVDYSYAGLVGRERGQTLDHLTLEESFLFLKKPTFKPTIQVRPLLAANEAAGVIDHEDQHAQDYLDHPQIGYLALYSKLPGRGLSRFWLEIRGYRREYGGIQIKGALGSMTTGYKVSLAAELAGTIATAAVAALAWTHHLF